METDDITNLSQKLQEALDECARLKEENERLKNQLTRKHDTARNSSGCINEQKAEFKPTEKPFSPEEKIRIFRSLFRGREDIFAIRWVSRKGKSG